MTTFEESDREETNADNCEGGSADERDTKDAHEKATDTASSEQPTTEPSQTAADSTTTEEAGAAADGERDSEEPEATPQSPELRRQQYAVGVGAAIIAGFALAISSMQHFPSLHEAVPIIAGFVGAGLVYWIVQSSLYPTEEELATGE